MTQERIAINPADLEIPPLPHINTNLPPINTKTTSPSSAVSSLERVENELLVTMESLKSPIEHENIDFNNPPTISSPEYTPTIQQPMQQVQMDVNHLPSHDPPMPTYAHVPQQWQNKITRASPLPTENSTLPLTRKDKPRLVQSKIAWADGLRGIAAAVVVSQHFVSAFAPDMNDGFGPEGAEPSFGLRHGVQFLTWPFFRILYAGNLAVSIFFILSGFVLPLGYFKKGDAQRLSSSIFRRVPRLLIPLIFFTLFSYILLITGGYNKARIEYVTELATGNPLMWFSRTSPTFLPPDQTYYFTSFLANTFVTTWYDGNNDYLAFAWTLRFELIGSILVYCAALGFRGNKYTVFYMLLPIVWCFNAITYHTTINIVPFFIGFVIAWLHMHPDDVFWKPYKYFQCTREDTVSEEAVSTATNCGRWCLFQTCPKPKLVTYWFVQGFWFLMLIFGIYLGSYPLRGIRVDYFLWLTELLQSWYPWFRDPEEWGYFVMVIAGSIIFTSCWILDSAQWVLSTRIPVFLGDISFMMYLWHGPLMLTFTAWLVSVLYPSLGYDNSIWVSYFVTWVVLIITSWIFTKTVDWLSIEVGKWLEKKSYKRD